MTDVSTVAAAAYDVRLTVLAAIILFSMELVRDLRSLPRHYTIWDFGFWIAKVLSVVS
jgi:hypothetical protein